MARRIVIDADTANEIDDLFAIVWALRAPELEVQTLCSAHFRIHEHAGPDSVGQSQRLNEDILRLEGRLDIPHPKGTNSGMGMAWGGEEPRDSAAVQAIIELARATPEGERLAVVTQGALTNLASAIKLAPEIIPKVHCYSMGFRCTSSGVWNKNEFNIRNDLNAADCLLNREGLLWNIMPADTCAHLTFDRDDTFRRLDGRGGIYDYLAARWREFAPQVERWIMWDLALVQAVARPELAKATSLRTPPENVQRDVTVYTEIDVEGMRSAFWELVG
jgi:inosine-uridine nucleoside N-ribohydrolase